MTHSASEKIHLHMENHPATLVEAFNEKGELISPILPEDKKNYLIDIDHTVCDDVPN